MKDSQQKLRLKHIVDHLDDMKGVNPLILNVSEFSNVTDYLVIVDGLVNRHVSALGRTLVKQMKEHFSERPLRVEGMQAGEWILVDYSDIIIHVFQPGLRERYDLESLWKEGKEVSLV